MNKNDFEGRWKEIRGRSKELWSLINDLDLSRVDKAASKLDKYVVLLQVKYGYTKQYAKEEISRRLDIPEPEASAAPGMEPAKSGIAASK